MQSGQKVQIQAGKIYIIIIHVYIISINWIHCIGFVKILFPNKENSNDKVFSIYTGVGAGLRQWY